MLNMEERNEEAETNCCRRNRPCAYHKDQPVYISCEFCGGIRSFFAYGKRWGIWYLLSRRICECESGRLGQKTDFFHHDGETFTSEEYALGDWIYFKYQCDKLARMKNDGSAFKVLHTFSGDSFFISGTKDNRLYHYTDACPRMYGIILRRIALFRWIYLLYWAWAAVWNAGL